MCRLCIIEPCGSPQLVDVMARRLDSLATTQGVWLSRLSESRLFRVSYILNLVLLL